MGSVEGSKYTVCGALVLSTDKSSQVEFVVLNSLEREAPKRKLGSDSKLNFVTHY